MNKIVAGRIGERNGGVWIGWVDFTARPMHVARTHEGYVGADTRLAIPPYVILTH